MAIVSFWSSRKRETNQSISAIASALQLGIDRNLKILLIETAFADNTYDKCFSAEESNEFVKTLNKGKLDISSGVEGLILAVTSNKSTPEIIQNYTQPILTGRLDLLKGMSTKSKDIYRNAYVNYPDIVDMANKFYDIVIVDLGKGFGDKVTTKILAMSDLIVVTFDQDKDLIADFERIWGNDPLFSPKERVIPLLTKEDRFSVYNNNNVARQIKMSPGMPSIIYNTQLMEAVQRGEGAKFFIDLNLASDTSRNKLLLDVVADLNMLLIDRIQQQRYKGNFNKNSVEDTIRNHIKYMNKEGKSLNKTEEEKQAEEALNQKLKEKNKEVENVVDKQAEDGLSDIKENIDQDILNQHSENVSEDIINKAKDTKEEEKKGGIFGIFKNIFGNKEEKDNLNQVSNSNINNQNNLNDPNSLSKIDTQNLQNGNEIITQNPNQNIDNNLNQNQNQNINNLENKNQMDILNDLDEMSKEAAKNISNTLNETDKKEVEEVNAALSQAEKIMLENKKLLKKLEEEAKNNKEEKRSNLDFSNVKPLSETETNKTDLYKIDDDGKIDYDGENELLEKNINELDEKANINKPQNSIDFSNIKPLSEEKDDIEMQKNIEIQEKIKSKILDTQKAKEAEEQKEIKPNDNNTNSIQNNSNNNEKENIQNLENQNNEKSINENKNEIENKDSSLNNNSQNQNQNENINTNVNNTNNINNITNNENNDVNNNVNNNTEITNNNNNTENNNNDSNSAPVFNPILGIMSEDNEESKNDNENTEQNDEQNKKEEDKNSNDSIDGLL